MNKRRLLAVLLSIVTVCASAQNFSGDLSPLKGQKEVNVVLDWTGMLVNEQPEESHIEFSIKDKNEEEKAQWLKEWNEDMRLRSYNLLVNRWALSKGLNERISETGLSVGDYPNAEYTIYIKVINIDNGYALGNAELTAEVSFIKTGESTPFATVTYDKCYGNAGFANGHHIERIARCFITLHIKLAKTINKEMKK